MADYIDTGALDALDAKLAAQERAADRYRWLRDECQKPGGLTIAKVGAFALEPWSSDDPDRAIDNAMAAALPAAREAPTYWCNKCGYDGPVQTGHQRPNGSGECHYSAVLLAPGTAPQAPIFDVESMLAACIPGGSICDPQQVADAVRAYFVAGVNPTPPNAPPIGVKGPSK